MIDDKPELLLEVITIGKHYIDNSNRLRFQSANGFPENIIDNVLIPVSYKHLP